MSESKKPTILISGVGNELRQDDGFGVAVTRRLQENNNLPERVKIVETGIAGISLVQELMTGYDTLLLIDAVSRNGQLGQLYWLEPEVPDLEALPVEAQRDFLADMHYANPTRALILAKAMRVLPPQVYILGCEAAPHDDFAMGLSLEVQNAIPPAVARIEKWLAELGAATVVNSKFCVLK